MYEVRLLLEDKMKDCAERFEFFRTTGDTDEEVCGKLSKFIEKYSKLIITTDVLEKMAEDVIYQSEDYSMGGIVGIMSLLNDYGCQNVVFEVYCDE